MRRDAITRKTAFSKRSTMAPVWFRRVAAGLMMESVRSTAMLVSGSLEAWPYSGGKAGEQADGEGGRGAGRIGAFRHFCDAREASKSRAGSGRGRREADPVPGGFRRRLYQRGGLRSLGGVA